MFVSLLVLNEFWNDPSMFVCDEKQKNVMNCLIRIFLSTCSSSTLHKFWFFKIWNSPISIFTILFSSLFFWSSNFCDYFWLTIWWWHSGDKRQCRISAAMGSSKKKQFVQEPCCQLRCSISQCNNFAGAFFSFRHHEIWMMSKLLNIIFHLRKMRWHWMVEQEPGA